MSKLGRQAETIQGLIDIGKLSESDLPLLIQEGLDPKIVDYWREHYRTPTKLQKEDKMTTDVMQLIDKLTSAVSFKFKEDGTSPNVTISKLRNGNYYCSVVRYAKSGGAQKKVVVCKAETPSLEDSVKNVVSAFLKVAQPQPDPLVELDKLANG